MMKATRKRRFSAAERSSLPDWQHQAACVQYPDLFFPQRAMNARIDAAKMVCRACPVILACLEDMLEFGYASDGIWAGMSLKTRQKVKLMRKKPCPTCSPSEVASCELCEGHGYIWVLPRREPITVEGQMSIDDLVEDHAGGR
jgi:WhiB family redox-sensing transcriptional regulator